MSKEFIKIHKLYKDIQEVYIDCGFINIVISTPLKDTYIYQSNIKESLEDIYKLELSFITLTIFKDKIYLVYEVKNEI